MRLIPFFILASALSPAAQAAGSVRARIQPVPALSRAGLGTLGSSFHAGLPSLGAGMTLASDASLAVPALSPAALPTAAPALSAAPGAVPFQGVAGMAAALQPDLEALQAQQIQGETARGAAERLMAPILGESGSLPALAAPAAAAAPRRAPLVGDVAFSEGVSAPQRELLIETLSRRKAGWRRGLAAMGLKLDQPAAPSFRVRSAKDARKGGWTAFVVDWSQGETRVGSFQVSVPAKSLEPRFMRLAAPMPPAGRRIKMRFIKSRVVPGNPFGWEKTVTESEISDFLEAQGLRLLRKNHDGTYDVSVTGPAGADETARRLSGQGIVLYATPEAFSVPAANQVRVAFKKVAARGVVEEDVRDEQVGRLLARFGLRVLSVDRDGVYTAGAENLKALAAARALQMKPDVLYAAPVEFSPAWTRQLIVRFRKDYIGRSDGIVFEGSVSEDLIASVFKRHGLLVVSVLGERLYKVARGQDATAAKDLAPALAEEPVIASALALGGLPDAAVLSAVKGVIALKGRPWSATEYHAAYGQAYWNLETAGATPEQLASFKRLCDEAPVRGGGFNSYSRD